MLDIQQHILTALQPWRDRPSFCVAFSGGMDSTVLLYALAQLAKQQRLPALRAIYIQHGYKRQRTLGQHTARVSVMPYRYL